MQADLVLEKVLRVLHMDLQAVGIECETLGMASASESSKPTPSDTLLLKAISTPHMTTCPNRCTSYGSMVSIFIQSILNIKSKYIEKKTKI